MAKVYTLFQRHAYIYNQGQKGWDEFASTMFPYAGDTNTVRVKGKCPFPDPHSTYNVVPVNKNDLWISTLSR